jgi:uncharacterized protein YkwD
VRTSQLFISTLAATGLTVYLLLVEGRPPRYILVAPTTYVILRWLFTVIGRTRHYLYRGGRSGQSCSNCGGYITRQPSDWILTCHRCGWQEGIPVVRWVTRGVASSQFRRTISLRGVVVIGLCIFLIWTPVLPAIASMPLMSPTASSSSPEAEPTASPTPSPTPGIENEGYDLAEVRRGFQQLLNEERQSRGMQSLDQRETLQSMGQSHAENMAVNDYLGHVQPDGDSIEDRYNQRGLLPECRLPISGTERYYPGAENAYQGYVDTEIRRDFAPDVYVSDEDDLVQVIFQSWMNSEPHREAMLVSSADEMGLGITITEGDKVFVALELC